MAVKTNTKHAKKVVAQARPKRAKLNEIQVREIRMTAAIGTMTMTAMAEHYGVSIATVSRAARGKAWEGVK